MTPLIVPWVTAALAGSVTAVLWWVLLPRLPEPVTGERKVPYANLATIRGGLVVAVYSAAAAWFSSTLVAWPLLPPWLVLSTLGVGLAAIDGFTTWLPARPTRWTWLAVAVSAVIMVVGGAGWADVARAGAGAVLAGLLYYGLWRATNRGFGFGDVRFVPIVAAAAAATSWSTLMISLVAGSLLVLGHGSWHRLHHRPGLVPWAPDLTLGAFLALIITA